MGYSAPLKLGCDSNRPRDVDDDNDDDDGDDDDGEGFGDGDDHDDCQETSTSRVKILWKGIFRTSRGIFHVTGLGWLPVADTCNGSKMLGSKPAFALLIILFGVFPPPLSTWGQTRACPPL